jgi:hypothetical protein
MAGWPVTGQRGVDSLEDEIVNFSLRLANDRHIERGPDNRLRDKQ